jgi:hypothetical protein
MTGGLMQLLAVGAQDQYLSISPQMSYYKQIFRRHTNFSMQGVRNTFNSVPVLNGTSRITSTCKIGRVGDLLSDIYLSFQLPDIYCNINDNDDLRFRWIPNVANYMIYSYSLSIDTQLIDQRWGEWMDIWNQLSLTYDKQVGYEKLTGNIEEFIAPKSLKPLVILSNNRFAYSYYPAATQTRPSIPNKVFYVPLDFWFCKNPALALPLVSLQYQTINVSIEFRAIEDLYQIYDKYSGQYYSPIGFRNLPYYASNPDYTYSYNAIDVSISRFTAYGGGGPSIVNLNAYLECNYIFLDTVERNTIAASSSDFLIERIYRTNLGGIQQNGSATIDLPISNSIKELIWILRRSNAHIYNDWGNYTATSPENTNFATLNTAKILWNGAERFEEKPGAYFNLLQPYQYHSSTPREGIYVYSFALYPEKLQPSGTFNASKITTIQLYITTNKILNNNSSDYEISIYSLYYNIFRVIGGSGSMVFAS